MKQIRRLTPQETVAGRRPERGARVLTPPVDVYETDSAFVLVADMPGVTPETLEVQVERNTLTIRGHAVAEEAIPLYQEFQVGEYFREFVLSDEVDMAGVTATLTNGVLHLKLPKSTRAMARKIPVQTA